MPDGTYSYTGSNVKERHMLLISRLGLDIGNYPCILEVQLERDVICLQFKSGNTIFPICEI